MFSLPSTHFHGRDFNLKFRRQRTRLRELNASGHVAGDFRGRGSNLVRLAWRCDKNEHRTHFLSNSDFLNWSNSTILVLIHGSYRGCTMWKWNLINKNEKRFEISQNLLGQINEQNNLNFSFHRPKNKKLTIRGVNVEWNSAVWPFRPQGVGVHRPLRRRRHCSKKNDYFDGGRGSCLMNTHWITVWSNRHHRALSLFHISRSGVRIPDLETWILMENWNSSTQHAVEGKRESALWCLLFHTVIQWVFIRQLALSASRSSCLEVQMREKNK